MHYAYKFYGSAESCISVNVYVNMALMFYGIK